MAIGSGILREVKNAATRSTPTDGVASGFSKSSSKKTPSFEHRCQLGESMLEKNKKKG